jgi:hypothetical protein
MEAAISSLMARTPRRAFGRFGERARSSLIASDSDDEMDRPPKTIRTGVDEYDQNLARLLELRSGVRYPSSYVRFPVGVVAISSGVSPEEDPSDADDGAIWSLHYFFFNPIRKRVCYIFLRAIARAKIRCKVSIVVRPLPSRCSGHLVGGVAEDWNRADLFIFARGGPV